MTILPKANGDPARCQGQAEPDRSELPRRAGACRGRHQFDRAGRRRLLRDDGAFSHLCFEPFVERSSDYGMRHGMASFAQIELIRARRAVLLLAFPRIGARPVEPHHPDGVHTVLDVAQL